VVAQLEYSSAVGSQMTSTLLQNQVNTYTFDELPLQRGGQLGPVTLAYETWGTLNA
jgi:homoserine O-acetyltransferase